MQDVTPTADPEKDAATLEMRAILEAAVAALPESYRTVFMLRSIEDMSTAETAECLDVTPDVVKTRLHRARGSPAPGAPRARRGVAGRPLPVRAEPGATGSWRAVLARVGSLAAAPA